MNDDHIIRVTKQHIIIDGIGVNDYNIEEVCCQLDITDKQVNEIIDAVIKQFKPIFTLFKVYLKK